MPLPIVINPPRVRAACDVVLDADWRDELPPLLKNATEALDLTDKAIEIVVRPTFDHDTLIARLGTKAPLEGIVIDTPSSGRSFVRIAQADVLTLFGAYVGTWEWFALLIEPDGVFAEFLIRELWRGPFRVHAGSTA